MRVEYIDSSNKEKSTRKHCRDRAFYILLLSLPLSVQLAPLWAWEDSSEQISNQEDKAFDNRVERAANKLEKRLANAEADLEMYQQMGQVNNWLMQWCLWNHHWPEPLDETNDAQRQLAELVPNNPYQWSKPQQSSGFSTDPSYNYYDPPVNLVDDAATGFAGNSMAPGTSWGSLGPKRVRLEYNPSLTKDLVREWETDPPETWSAEPGTITGISNSMDLIVVWGAGADGKPLRVPGSPKTRLYVSNVQMSPTGLQND